MGGQHFSNIRNATGRDEIVIEILRALDDFRIIIFIEMRNEINDSGEITEDLRKSVLIAIMKKNSANEYELYRAISVMIHIIKLNIRF